MDLGSTDMTEIEGGPKRLSRVMGLEYNDEAVMRELDIDIRGVGGILTPKSILARVISDTEYTDAWGIGYRWNGHHYEAVGRPLAGAAIEDLEKYPWPKAQDIDKREIEKIRQSAKYLYEDTPYVVCGRHPFFGVMELGCWLCGFDDFLYRMAAEPEFVIRLFDIIWDYQKQVMELYYGAIGSYIHFTTSGDDFGTQTGPFCSPGMFGELVFPYLKERISRTKKYTDAAFFHHTCGSVYALIPQLIAAGVDILNPIQPRAKDMEPGRLKSEFGDRLAFYGGVDTQILLPQGTPEEVYNETCDLISLLASEGGYILSAAHVLQGDVPDRNIVAMYEAGMGSPLGLNIDGKAGVTT